MTHIDTDQDVPENGNLKVLSVSGDYSDNDLIQCYDTGHPGLAVGCFQAQYIKYGGIVYRFNTPEDLGEALFQIDPTSTHDAVLLYQQEAARDQARDAGTLKPDDPVPADQSISPIARQDALDDASSTDATSTDQTSYSDKPADTSATQTSAPAQTTNNNSNNNTSTATTTPSVPDTSSAQNTATTTPDTSTDSAATSTPAIDPIPTDPTSTPAFIDTSTATTTPDGTAASSSPIDSNNADLTSQTF